MILAIYVFMLISFWIFMIAVGNLKTEEEQALEDLEQMEYLREYKERHDLRL